MSSEGGATEKSSSLRQLNEWLTSPTQPETGSTLLRVVSAPGGAWVIREPGRDKALEQLKTREHAVALASSTLAEARGGEVEVFELDGTTSKISVPRAKRPWWQATRTPRAALLLGLLWLGLTTLRLVDGGWPIHRILDGVMLMVGGALGTFYLLSAVLLKRRRERP